MLERITGEEFDEALAHYEVSAFRLEQQPVYRVSYEVGHLEAFLAGDPIPPEQMPGFSEWLDNIRRNAAAGRPMSRVRVHDLPPTDYQRWLRWVDDTYNREAGEVIYYVPRPAAIAVGITPDLGDWWLLDSSRVLTLNFDATGHPADMTLTDEPERVAEALRWQAVALELAAHDYV